MWFKQFLQRLNDSPNSRRSGLIGAIAGFAFVLLWMIFGLFKTIFILLITGVGYVLGNVYFADKKSLKALLDRIFPPGFFR